MSDAANLGGQQVEAEDITATPGKATIAVKIHTGDLHVDGGPVSVSNPLPVNATFSGAVTTTDPTNVSADGAAVPAKSGMMGASDGTNLQAVRGKASAVDGTEFGVIVRPIPSGTQAVSATQLPAALVDALLGVTLPGLTAWQSATIAVDVTATRLDPTPLAGRKTITVACSPDNEVPIYIGPADTVTVGGGSFVYPGQTRDFDFDASVQVWAIAAVTAQATSVDEVA